MSARKSFLLRVSPDLYTALEKWAADELRSVNGQIEYLLARAVKDAKRAHTRHDPAASTDAAAGDEPPNPET